MADFKKGDRVKVSAFEGVVRATDSGGVDVESEDGKFLAWVEDVKRIQIEKIEPPVEVFGRGDTVRSKVSGNLWSIGIDGVFDHCTGVFVSGAEHAQGFTSKHFEKVNLG